MAREPARNDEQGVDPHIVAVSHEAWREPLGGYRDAAKAILIEREGGRISIRTRLHFDKGDGAPAAGDEIDFAARNARAAGEDSPSVQAKPPGGEGLGAAPATFGLLAFHQSGQRR